MDAFDGAGREYRQPRYMAILLLGLVIVVLIGLAWVVAAGYVPAPEASSGT
jgi:hypothetical protein